MNRKIQERLMAVAATALCIVFGITSKALAQEAAGDQLMIVSDLHYLSPALMTNGGVNLQKEIDNDNKMFDKASDVLQAVVGKALEQRPAGLLITGDLTRNGEQRSHTEVAAALQQLVDAGIKVWVVPGNHDVNNTNAKTYTGGMVRTAASPTSADFVTTYANMGYNDAIERDPNSLSYVCEPLPGLRLIAVDDNLCKERDKNKSLEANGISAKSLTWILAKADEAAAAGKQVMVMMHHQLVPHIDAQESLLGDAMVADVDNVRSSFLAHGLRLALTGHIHISNGTTWYTDGRADSIVEVTTGSVIAYPCHVRTLSFDPATGKVEFAASRITKTASDSNFGAYALQRAKDGTRATVSSIVWHNWSNISSMLEQFGASISQEDFVDACYAGLGDVIGKLTITMSEGNERQSGVTPSQLSRELDSGIESTVNTLLAGQNFLVRMMAYGVVKEVFHDMLDEAMYSALNDETCRGTELADVTDDLSPVMWLPVKATPSLKGDVNADGVVDVADLNALINLVLEGAGDGAADVNEDGAVDIADINALINIILQG
ncbi:MAG: metallophosphoesterase [Bacteroidales bacterium]|nr:metallophosphoesterase [Candidatus Sodaliphilus aphodohippi]